MSKPDREFDHGLSEFGILEDSLVDELPDCDMDHMRHTHIDGIKY